MSRISRRVGAITESATLAVDAKAKALQAAGEDVVGFGAGEPDFPTPAHIVEVAAPEAVGFRVTIEQLEAARTPRTKVLLFVSPSNPTGAVYPRAEVEAIGQWAVEHGIWVLTDEIYEHLTYGDHEFTSMPAVV